VLLDQGRQLLSGRTNELLHGTGYQLTFENLPVDTRLPSASIARDGVKAVYHSQDDDQQAVIQQAWAEGATLIDLRRTAETLTELFLRTTALADSQRGQSS
jgi:hypothetical protein